MSAEMDISKRISGISNKIRQSFYASFLDNEITDTQALILHFLALTTPRRDVFQRDIEAEFSIRRSSVTSVLSGLEKKGYIRRESVLEDARLKKLVLTDKADQLAERINELIHNINNTLLKDISREDIMYLDVLLKKISNNLP